MGSRSLPFTKMQAVGNDFVVVEETKWPADTDWSGAAIRLCDRHFGVGADGLLVVGPSEVADVRMRMFNPDGTEDMCGNGLRCVAWLAYRRNRFHPVNSADYPYIPPNEVDRLYRRGTIETLVGIRRCVVFGQRFINTDMGNPRFAPEQIPVQADVEIPTAGYPPIFLDALAIESQDNGSRPRQLWTSDAIGIVSDYPLAVPGHGQIFISCVNTGSTHTVLWCDELPDDHVFQTISPLIENHEIFPERTSVLWAKIDDEQRIHLRIWERGAGETLGCGTGACAAAVMAFVEKKLPYDPNVERYGEYAAYRAEVISRGGTLQVDWFGLGDGHMELIGPADIVYTGVWDAEG